LLPSWQLGPASSLPEAPNEVSDDEGFCLDFHPHLPAVVIVVWITPQAPLGCSARGDPAVRGGNPAGRGTGLQLPRTQKPAKDCWEWQRAYECKYKVHITVEQIEN
jgi:hypothetical protein